MKAMFKKWLPFVVVVVVALVVWSEVSGYYVKARSAVLKTVKGE